MHASKNKTQGNLKTQTVRKKQYVKNVNQK